MADTRDILKYFTDQYGLDIETMGVDFGRNEVLQVGIQTPAGRFFEINVQQAAGFQPGKLQRFHQQEGRLAPYYMGKTGTPSLDLTNPVGFHNILDQNNLRVARTVAAKEQAQMLTQRLLSNTNKPGNIIIHNAKFEINHFDRWFDQKTSPIAWSQDYKNIINDNKNARRADLTEFRLGKLSAEQVRIKDRARQARVYNQILKEARAGNAIIDTMEIAKMMNAEAQKLGLISKGSELSIGTNVQFLARTLLNKEELHRAAQDVAMQNALAPKLVEYTEALKRGEVPKGLERWVQEWQDPTKIKINAQTRAIESAIEGLAKKGRFKVFSGSMFVNTYQEYYDYITRGGKFSPPSFATQGRRIAEYDKSVQQIYKAAEANISSYHRGLLDSVGTRKKFSGVSKLGRYGVGVAATLGLGYIAANVFSGKDDNYNTIQGLNHGWFGQSRSLTTDFGSGFTGRVQSFSERISNPMFLSQVERDREARNKESLAQAGEIRRSDLMMVRDQDTLEGINFKRKQLREFKLAQYQLLIDDADTLVLQGKGTQPIQIRLAGIDAPEVLHSNDPIKPYRINQAQPGGEEATRRLQSIAEGGDLRLFVDPTQRTYGRYLGVLYKGKTNVNLQLVREGRVSALEFGSVRKDLIHRGRFSQEGRLAESEGRGIWGHDFFRDWKAFSAGAGRDVTFNSFTDILRLARSRYLAQGAAEMWEDGYNPEVSYRYGALHKMYNSFSAKDDTYNSISGMSHSWFGKQRKENTDFGSGYKSPDQEPGFKQGYREPTPVDWWGLTQVTGGMAAVYAMWNRPVSFFGRGLDINKLSYMGQFPGRTSDFLGRSAATYGDVIYNAIRRVELSMAGLPKAFSVSTLMSPSILKGAEFSIELGKVPFDPNKVRRSTISPKYGYGYADYLDRIVGRDLIKEGFSSVTYKQGKLYGINARGAEEVILKEAKLYQRIHDPNITKSVSQFAKSYEHTFNVAGVGREHEFLIGGGHNKMQARFRAMHAYSHETLSKYLRLVDDPIKAFRETFPNISPGLTAGIEKFTKHFPKFGVGGEKQLIGTVPQLLGRHTAKALPLLIGLPAAFGTLNWMTRQLSPEGTVGEKAGMTGVAAEGVRLAHMGLAHISEAAGLTGLRQHSEERAPGLVGIKPFIGFTLSGIMSGTALGMGVGLAEELRAPGGRQRYEAMIAAKTKKAEALSDLGKVPGMRGAYTRGVRWGKYGGLAAATLALPFLLMGMGASKSVRDLNAEYLEGEEVPVRKARWWEFGTTPWEGERIMYYRPNWYNRLLQGSEAKSIYSGEDISPIGKFIKDLADPYWLEKEHYEDRPYPIAGPSGEHLGLFGPLYEWTIGRVMKPPVYMHTEDWMGGYTSHRGRQYQPSKELGGLAPDQPVTPYSLEEQVKQQYYTVYEAMGLRGFMTSVIKEKITGEQDMMEFMPILQSSADIESPRRSFWDLNLGGLMGLTEPYRRFVPNRPYTTDFVNPVPNKMPEWIPGKDYFIDFQSGDPFVKIPEGEARLPGAGYEARYPELEGMSPEKYPLIHKYKILADVAMYSKEFRNVRRELQKYDPTDYEMEIFLETERQLEEKRKRKEFRDDIYDESVLGRYGAALVDVARASPLEQLTPLAPAHKFLPPTTPLGRYEESIYGKEFKLWQRPIDDFVKPFATTLGNMIGIDRIPGHIQEARQIEKYFDELKYVKFKELESQAWARGAEGRAKYYRNEWSRTLAGTDVYSNEFRLVSALPKREKEFFQEFKAAEPEDKMRILELIPHNMRDLYVAQWDKEVLKSLQEGKLEGTPEEQYNLEKEIFDRMTMIRNRRRAAAEALDKKSNLPDENWIGWRADVDLEDIKLKYLVNTSRDYHYYNLWDDRLRSLRRKPYLDEALEGIEPLAMTPEDVTYSEIYRNAIEMGIQDPRITEVHGIRSGLNVDLKYDRDHEINHNLKELGKIL